MTRSSLASDWQDPASMGRDLPTMEETRRRALAQVVRKIMRARAVLLPIAALFLSLVVLYDQDDSWVIAALATVVAVQLAVVVFDLLRLRRRYDRPWFVPADMMIMVLVQTGLVWLTGAVESPLIVIYIPVGLMTGVALGRARSRWIPLGLVTAALWAMAVSGLAGWVPRTTPSFLGLEPGYHDSAVYVVVKAAVVNIVVVVASIVGTQVHRAITRMLDRAIDARQQALDALTDRNRELASLSGAIAHELKNPLASIHGLVQLLERGGGPGGRTPARIAMLRGEVDRMRGVLDELLNFSRPLGELSLERVAAGALLRELTTLHEGIAVQRDVAIADPPAAATGIALRCDPRKIKQALVNLLQNALEAAPRGGTVGWVARADEAGVVLGVHDDGPGFSPRLLERAADPGVTTKPTGSGIGLSVCRAIARQHGGRLVLRNRPAGGGEALLELPRRQEPA